MHAILVPTAVGSRKDTALLDHAAVRKYDRTPVLPLSFTVVLTSGVERAASGEGGTILITATQSSAYNRG